MSGKYLTLSSIFVSWILRAGLPAVRCLGVVLLREVLRSAVELGGALAQPLELLLQRVRPLVQVLRPRNRLIRLALPLRQEVLLGIELTLQARQPLGVGVGVGHSAPPWREALGAR
jgi:hypothetical protein